MVGGGAAAGRHSSELFTFVRTGTGADLGDDARSVRKSQDSNAYALCPAWAPSVGAHTGPAASASAAFRLDFDTENMYADCIGVFPADQSATADVATPGEGACAIRLYYREVQIYTNRERAEVSTQMGFEEGEVVVVTMERSHGQFRVGFTFKEQTEWRVLQNVPACGLCFGAGLYQGHGVAAAAEGRRRRHSAAAAAAAAAAAPPPTLPPPA